MDEDEFERLCQRWGEPVAMPGEKPEPGTICPTCGNRTPNENALRQRAWRKRQEEKVMGGQDGR